MLLPRLAQGIDVAGLKRFPQIGQVFNTLKSKTRHLADLDHEHIVLSMACSTVEKRGTTPKDEDASNPINENTLRMPIKDVIDDLKERIGESHAPINSLAIKQMVSSNPWLRCSLTVKEGYMQLHRGLREELDAHYNEKKKLLFAKYLPVFDDVRSASMGMNKANEEQVGQAISDLVAEREPSDKNKEAVQKVVKTVGLIGRQVLAGARVNASLFGSRKYGLATQTSDVDILLSVRVPSEDAEINHAKFFNRFAKRLRKTPGFHVLATITHARVPIVKFEFRSRADGCIQGDISLNASMGMSKTSMLESYISMDKRVKDVMSVVRAWSTARNITSSTSLNSYSLSLMVLAFLVSRRVVPPLQLTRTRQFTRTGWQRLEEIQRNPDEIRNLYDYTISGGKGAELSCIQTNEPLPDWRVDGTRAYFLGTGHGETWESPNKHSSTTLLYEFFRYYGFDFDPMQHVVSLRLGSPEIPRMSLYELQAPEPAMYMTLPTQWRQDLRLLAIEDPFEVEHNCARQVPGEWVEGFLWEMRRAAWSLLPGKSVGLQRLLANPTTDAFRDASVWASAYHRLFPVIQDLLGEQVFSKSELAVPGKVVDLEELEKIDE